MDADAGLMIDGATGSGPTLTQNDGLVKADGPVLLDGGFLDFEGGAVTGAFTVDGSQIYVDPGVTDPSQIRVVGGGNLLLDDGSASTTLLVQGDDAYDEGVLTVAPDATNAGVIQLDSASGYWGSSLVIQDMLDNLPGGSILVTPGAGGGRSIAGDIDNEGLLSVAANESVAIDGETDAGPTFIQDGGLIQADGRLILDGGLFDFESGDVSGSFLVNDSQIYVGPGATDPATVYVVGAGNTLLGNEGPSVTLQVEGDDGFGQGVLTAAAGAVNAGSVVLDSTSSYFGSALAAPDTLLNASGGLIAVADDGGGSRSPGRRLHQRRHHLRAARPATVPPGHFGRRPDADPIGRPHRGGGSVRAGRRPVRLRVGRRARLLPGQQRPNLRRAGGGLSQHGRSGRAVQHPVGRRLGGDDLVGAGERRLRRGGLDSGAGGVQRRHDRPGVGQRRLGRRAAAPTASPTSWAAASPSTAAAGCRP